MVIAPRHIGDADFAFQALGQTEAARQRHGQRIAFDFTHIDQANQQGGNHGIAHQRHPVAGGVAVLDRGLQHVVAGLGQDAGLLEDLGHLQRRFRLRWRSAHPHGAAPGIGWCHADGGGGGRYCIGCRWRPVTALGDRGGAALLGLHLALQLIVLGNLCVQSFAQGLDFLCLCLQP
jgi:hypothetical protein